MRSYRLLAAFWTLGIAIPFTVLALVCTALLWKALEWTASLPAIQWGAILSEGSARWPELAAMVIGQAVIMILLLLSLRSGRLQEEPRK